MRNMVSFQHFLSTLHVTLFGSTLPVADIVATSYPCKNNSPLQCNFKVTWQLLLAPGGNFPAGAILYVVQYSLFGRTMWVTPYNAHHLLHSPCALTYHRMNLFLQEE